MTDAIEAAHAAICEDSLSDCIEYRGRCVKAVNAAAPHMLVVAWDEGYVASVREDSPSWTKNPYRNTP